MKRAGGVAEVIRRTWRCLQRVRVDQLENTAWFPRDSSKLQRANRGKREVPEASDVAGKSGGIVDRAEFRPTARAPAEQGS